jgi:hypothetical protein
MLQAIQPHYIHYANIRHLKSLTFDSSVVASRRTHLLLEGEQRSQLEQQGQQHNEGQSLLLV